MSKNRLSWQEKQAHKRMLQWARRGVEPINDPGLTERLMQEGRQFGWLRQRISEHNDGLSPHD